MANLNNAGGTNGGGGSFFLGVALAAAGAYMLASRASVGLGGFGGYGGYGYGHMGYMSFFGVSPFGAALIPFMLGFGLLFANGSSKAGWALTIGGLAIIIVGIILNLQLHFQQTSLFEMVMMLGMLAAGLGLVARSLRDYAKNGV